MAEAALGAQAARAVEAAELGRAVAGPTTVDTVTAAMGEVAGATVAPFQHSNGCPDTRRWPGCHASCSWQHTLYR